MPRGCGFFLGILKQQTIWTRDGLAATNGGQKFSIVFDRCGLAGESPAIFRRERLKGSTFGTNDINDIYSNIIKPPDMKHPIFPTSHLIIRYIS